MPLRLGTFAIKSNGAGGVEEGVLVAGYGVKRRFFKKGENAAHLYADAYGNSSLRN